MTAQGSKALEVAQGAACEPKTAAEFNEAMARTVGALPKVDLREPTVVARYVLTARALDSLYTLARFQGASKSPRCAGCSEVLYKLLQQIECVLDIEP